LYVSPTCHHHLYTLHAMGCWDTGLAQLSRELPTHFRILLRCSRRRKRSPDTTASVSEIHCCTDHARLTKLIAWKIISKLHRIRQRWSPRFTNVNRYIRQIALKRHQTRHPTVLRSPRLLYHVGSQQVTPGRRPT